MEERRLEGRRLGQQRIAEELGVSRYTATRWAKELKGGGVEALLSRKASGRPPRLSQEGAARLLQALRQGAKAHGYADVRWTPVRIAEVLQKEAGVMPDPDHLSLVMRRLGRSVQRAQPKAAERDEQAFATRIETTLPGAPKKGSRAGRSHLR